MFCRYCGNGLSDDAFVCPKCGCLVNEPTQKVHSSPASQEITAEPSKPSRKFLRLKKIFSIVGTVLSGAALLCGVYFVYLMATALAIGEGGGLVLAIFSLFGFYFAIGISPFALAAGILAFVFGGKTEKRGAFAVTAFVLGIVSFVLSWGLFVVLITS